MSPRIKSVLSAALLAGCSLAPSLAQAKIKIPIPVFFATGDEIFEVKDPVKLEVGPYKLGYACKHFALFEADVWTWDCKLMLVDKVSFSAAPVPEDPRSIWPAHALKPAPRSLAELEELYPLSRRVRGFWNAYAFWTLMGLLALAVWLGRSGKKQARPLAA